LESPLSDVLDMPASDPIGNAEIMERRIFPSLNMAEWVSRLVQKLDTGEVTTFSSIARGLGDPRAARAVAELITKGKVEGPVHRVIYADGTPLIPERLGEEMDIKEAGPPIEFSTFGPLMVLATIQRTFMPSGKKEMAFRYVAGADVSYDEDGASGAIYVMEVSGELIGSLTGRGHPLLPYIPGYLFYREAPVLLPLLIEARDGGLLDGTLTMIDGNGRLHPRRAGIACQIGALARISTCGIAKRLMLGRVGDWSDSGPIKTAHVCEGGDILGLAIRRGKGLPIYLSEGNMTDLVSCAEITFSSLGRRLPQPLRMAHILANEDRRLRNRTVPS